MTWQDELRQLDNELAAGQLSAEDYRRRRDELMTRRYAAEGGRDQGGQGQASTPFPPAFRWETTPNDSSNETTQQISPVDAEDTQVVSPRPVDTDRTQVVSGSGVPPAQPGPQDMRPGPPDVQRPGPPPGPPPPRDPATDWMREPEPVESAKSSRTPIVVAAVTAVVVVLAAAGFGAFWLWGGNGTPRVDAPAAAQQPPDRAAPAGDRAGAGPTTAPQPPLPGFAEIGGSGRPRTLPTLTDLESTGALTPQEFAVLAKAGAADSRLLLSSFENGPQATLLVTRLPSPQAAIAARDDLAGLQREFGLLPAPTPDPGLRSFYVIEDPAMGPTVRGVYRNGLLLVRIEVTGKQAVPTARRYDTIIEQQLATLPADP